MPEHPQVKGKRTQLEVMRKRRIEDAERTGEDHTVKKPEKRRKGMVFQRPASEDDRRY